MPTVDAGGIVGFSARDAICDIINIATFGIPGIGLHHVGITSLHRGRMLLYESTSSDRPPCFFAKRKTKGVGARPVEDMLVWAKEHNTKLWYYPLRYPLYAHEIWRLDSWLYSHVGRPYDMDGCLHAGGGLLYLALAAFIRGENLDHLFCSEMDAAAFVYLGRFQTSSASKWNPNKLCRHLVRIGVCGKPVRIA